MKTRTRCLIVLLVLAWMSIGTQPAFAQSFPEWRLNFTPIAIPGATFVHPKGINNHGDVVGAYATGTSPSRGFLLRDGVLTDIVGPGAVFTYASGINTAGDIVGAYVDAAGIEHGFLLRKGVFTTIDSPLATGGVTAAKGINARGDIVGIYCPGDSFHGFVLRKGVFTYVDPSGAQDSYLNGINRGGDLVGSWDKAFNDGFGQGFVLFHNEFVFFDIPGTTGVTEPYGVNADEVIVGSYLDLGGSEHGFRMRGADFTSIDYPGATSSTANGINDYGTIVGYSTVGGTVIGWVLSPDPQL